MKCNAVVIKILRLSFIGLVQTIFYFLELQGLEEEILVAHLQSPSPGHHSLKFNSLNESSQLKFESKNHKRKSNHQCCNGQLTRADAEC